MIDPLRRNCSCGFFWHFNKWDYVKMILFGKIIVTCPHCHRRHMYNLIYHAVETYDDVKQHNNLLAEGKSIVWKHG